jgi:sugar phosphate isomerase/epimerase
VSDLKFSCQDKILPGETYTEKYLNAKKLGFDSIEVNASPKLPLKQRIQEIKEASVESEMLPSTVCGGYRGWIGHFDGNMRKTAIDDIKEIISLMPEIGASGLIVPAAYGMFSKKLPPFIPPRDKTEDHKILTESLSIIGKYASEYGINIYLEPLNRYEDHMVNTVSDAVSIVASVNLPSVSVMLDFFHANIEETDIAASILEHKEFIKHIHLADSNRYQPGVRHLDFSRGLKALKDAGFNGFCALECSISGEGMDPFRRTLQFLKQYI